MRKLLICLYLQFTVSAHAQQIAGQVTAQPGNLSGDLYASSFGQWTVPQGDDGGFTWNSAKQCVVAANGLRLDPVFAVGTPITIVDNVPAKTEIVVPTAVRTGNFGCSITVHPVNRHFSFYLQSATAGLQEAINFSRGLPYRVIVTPDWSRMGGQTSMLTAAIGSQLVSILDSRTNCPVPYTWNGTAYVAGNSFCNSGGGGATPAPPSFAVQLANQGATQLAADPQITINTSTHQINVGTISGNTVQITNSSAIPASWMFDVTSPSTACATITCMSTLGATATGLISMQNDAVVSGDVSYDSATVGYLTVQNSINAPISQGQTPVIRINGGISTSAGTNSRQGASTITQTLFQNEGSSSFVTFRGTCWFTQPTWNATTNTMSCGSDGTHNSALFEALYSDGRFIDQPIPDTGGGTGINNFAVDNSLGSVSLPWFAYLPASAGWAANGNLTANGNLLLGNPYTAVPGQFNITTNGGITTGVSSSFPSTIMQDLFSNIASGGTFWSFRTRSWNGRPLFNTGTGVITFPSDGSNNGGFIEALSPVGDYCLVPVPTTGSSPQTFTVSSSLCTGGTPYLKFNRAGNTWVASPGLTGASVTGSSFSGANISTSTITTSTFSGFEPFLVVKQSGDTLAQIGNGLHSVSAITGIDAGASSIATLNSGQSVVLNYNAYSPDGATFNFDNSAIAEQVSVGSTGMQMRNSTNTPSAGQPITFGSSTQVGNMIRGVNLISGIDGSTTQVLTLNSPVADVLNFNSYSPDGTNFNFTTSGPAAYQMSLSSVGLSIRKSTNTATANTTVAWGPSTTITSFGNLARTDVTNTFAVGQVIQGAIANANGIIIPNTATGFTGSGNAVFSSGPSISGAALTSPTITGGTASMSWPFSALNPADSFGQIGSNLHGVASIIGMDGGGAAVVSSNSGVAVNSQYNAWSPDGSTFRFITNLAPAYQVSVSSAGMTVRESNNTPSAGAAISFGDSTQIGGGLRRVSTISGIDAGPNQVVSLNSGVSDVFNYNAYSPDGTTFNFINSAQAFQMSLSSVGLSIRNSVNSPSANTPISWSGATTLTTFGNLARTDITNTFAAGQVINGAIANGNGIVIPNTAAGFTGGGALVFSSGASISGASISGSNFNGTATISGITNGSLATSGTVGETVIANVPFASAVGIASNTATPIMTVTLTPGDWDISCVGDFTAASATVSSPTWDIAISTNGSFTGALRSPTPIAVPLFSSTTFLTSVSIPSIQVTPTGTTAYSLVAISQFSAGSVAVYGSCQARRMR